MKGKTHHGIRLLHFNGLLACIHMDKFCFALHFFLREGGRHGIGVVESRQQHLPLTPKTYHVFLQKVGDRGLRGLRLLVQPHQWMVW